MNPYLECFLKQTDSSIKSTIIKKQQKKKRKMRIINSVLWQIICHPYCHGHIGHISSLVVHQARAYHFLPPSFYKKKNYLQHIHCITKFLVPVSISTIYAISGCIQQLPKFLVCSPNTQILGMSHCIPKILVCPHYTQIFGISSVCRNSGNKSCVPNSGYIHCMPKFWVLVYALYHQILDISTVKK